MTKYKGFKRDCGKVIDFAVHNGLFFQAAMFFLSCAHKMEHREDKVTNDILVAIWFWLLRWRLTKLTTHDKETTQ